MVPGPMLQQMVAFAALARGRDGQHEFHLKLNDDVLNGAQLSITSFAAGRVGLKIQTSGGGMHPGELSQLIASLRSKGIEVVRLDASA